jgi:chemotaxis protein MotB
VARKKRPQATKPPGAPEWIVTFTDMISLLVTFFVLMMTYSSMEDYDRLKIDGLLANTRTPDEQITGNAPIDALEQDVLSDTDMRRGSMVPHSRPSEELPEPLDEMGKKLQQDQLEIDFSVMSDGLRIRFDEDCSFAPGSAEVTPALRKSMAELGQVLQHYSHVLVIEGHTDADFRGTPSYPSAEALSIARARAAAEALLAGSDVPPLLIQVAAVNDRDPLATNEDPLGRRLNRRVEVRVLSMSRARAEHARAERQDRR